MARKEAETDLPKKPAYADLPEREQIRYDVAEIRSQIASRNTERAVELMADVLERMVGPVGAEAGEEL